MITDVFDLLEMLKTEFPVLYYINCGGFFLITLFYLMKTRIKLSKLSLIDLVTYLVTVIGLIILVAKEPGVFIFSVFLLISSQLRKILKFISDNSHVELNRYKKLYTNIIDQDTYTFLEILLIYNLISLEDYTYLFTHHADKNEQEMIKILEERVILDEDKKQTAMILFNQYKLNKELTDRNADIVIEIKKQLSNNAERDV